MTQIRSWTVLRGSVLFSLFSLFFLFLGSGVFCGACKIAGLGGVDCWWWKKKTCED